MNIYECIIPEFSIARLADSGLAITTAGITDCKAPTTFSVCALLVRKKSEKNAGFFATRTPTRPCVAMINIHFPRAVIHQPALARALRVTDKSSFWRRGMRPIFQNKCLAFAWLHDRMQQTTAR
jgi:hypothetical protein